MMGEKRGDESFTAMWCHRKTWTMTTYSWCKIKHSGPSLSNCIVHDYYYIFLSYPILANSGEWLVFALRKKIHGRVWKCHA
jgi:hypothetical protein